EDLQILRTHPAAFPVAIKFVVSCAGRASRPGGGGACMYRTSSALLCERRQGARRTPDPPADDPSGSSGDDRLATTGGLAPWPPRDQLFLLSRRQGGGASAGRFRVTPILLRENGRRKPHPKGEEGRDHDGEAEIEQTFQIGERLRLDEGAGRDRTGVSAGSDDAGHGSQRLSIYERHHTEGRAFAHLHEEREEDERSDGEAERRHLREQDEGQPLHKQNDEQEVHASREPARRCEAV